MSITQREIDQVFSDLKDTHCGLREDYFALLYLEREFQLPREHASVQVAFGGRDYGIDAFHLDPQRRNLYLFQFKWTSSYTSFKESFERLIDSGMEQIFGCSQQDQQINPVLLQLKSRLLNDRALVDSVFFHFVFNGDPAEAERSRVLDALREDLEDKKYLLDQYFGKTMSLVVEFRSAKTKQVGGLTHHRKTYKYPLEMQNSIHHKGPNGEQMRVGFVRLCDLHRMYADMGKRFFERNIRSGLSQEEAPNRAIRQSLKQIVLDEKESPAVFAFNHNGVTLFAERALQTDGTLEITEPRLLNGAQTITTFDAFLGANKDNHTLVQNRQRLEDLAVPCKVITEASRDFVVSVTINNNRQNPVMPWNLRANDIIQLQLQDKLADDLHIYYERQESMFESLSDEDLANLDITHNKAIELLRLAKTLLASDGLVDKMSNMRRVFEGDNDYSQVFNETRLRADSRKILLCYKIQFRLPKLVQAIMEAGATKYAFMTRARNLLWALLCQGVLNDPDLESYAKDFGESLVVEANYTEWLIQLAKTRARILIGAIIKEDPYCEHMHNENYGFLRTQAFFKKCMDLAHQKWGWVQKKLK